jgi:predicted dehydrogenase
MIHDIDIILGLVRSPVINVDAVGASVINPTEDIANARITFETGCVATVTASRISHKTQRTMRVFQPDGYLVCDYAESRIVHFQRKADPLAEGFNAISVDTQDIKKHDALQREIAEFVNCVRTGKPSTVDGIAGLKALEITNLIKDSLRAHAETCAQYQRSDDKSEKLA